MNQDNPWGLTGSPNTKSLSDRFQELIEKSKVPPSVPTLPISGKGLMEQLKDGRMPAVKSEYDKCVDWLNGITETIEEVEPGEVDKWGYKQQLTEDMIRKFLADVEHFKYK